MSELKRVSTKDQLKGSLFTDNWYKEAVERSDREFAQHIVLSKEYMWQNIIKESKYFLGALGAPYIESGSSAESQCAYLAKRGFADYSNSQNYDSLLFGCPNVIQNLSKSFRRMIQGKWTYSKVEPLFNRLY